MTADLSGPALRAAFFERCLGWTKSRLPEGAVFYTKFQPEAWLLPNGRMKYGPLPVESDPTACFKWVVPWIEEQGYDLHWISAREIRNGVIGPRIRTVMASWPGKAEFEETDPCLPTALVRLAVRIQESEETK